MSKLDTRLTRTTTWLAGVLAGLIMLSFPLAFFTLIYQYHIASMEVEAEFSAANVSWLINANPEFWQFEEQRLQALLKDQADEGLPELRRIVDAKGRVIVQSPDQLDTPTIMRTAALLDSGNVVGRFEVIRSLRPLLLETAMAGLFGLLLGGLVLVILRVYPLRALKRALETLANEKERAEVTLHSIGDAVITTDASGHIEYLNPVAEQLTGWSNEEANGLPLTQVLVLINETSGEAVDNPVAKVLSENRTVPLANHTALVLRDGQQIPIEDSAAPIRNHDGDILGVVMVFHDLRKQYELINRLTHQATHDTLTGLTNRGEFERRLNLALKSAREDGRHHTMCYLDLDQFKIVNDTCGHVAGDELLRQISVGLKTEVRDTDVLARLGGDEFGLLLPGCGIEQAQRIATNLIEAVKNYRFIWQDNIFNISVSIGLVAMNAQSQDVAQILSAADASCYVAKDKGRNRLQVYHPDDAELSQRRGEMSWASRIARALEEDRFTLYSQKVMPLFEGGEDGDHYEVLVRMLDEHGEMVAPSLFMPAAEHYNLMPAIDRWVVKNAFAHLHKKYFSGGDKRLHTCAINLSGGTFGDEGILDFIHDQATLHDVSAHFVCFEITETAAIANLGTAVSFIKNLKHAGFRFSLDDFGSGLSSFAYLKNLPVDYLKIDGGFVKDMVNNPIDAAMVQAINQIGHVMGIKTIAEFVENQAILDKLVEIGVDYAQGYGIARPRPLLSQD